MISSRQDQIAHLDNEIQTLRENLSTIAGKINEHEIEDPILDASVSELIIFSDLLIQKLRTKYDVSSNILKMWDKFNSEMENNPHLAEKWSEIMTVLALIN
jgi:hypothetical protein